MWLSDSQKIGAGLTGFGLFFMILGILLFFDPGLLAIGNALYLVGLLLLIGPQKTVSFFFRKNKLRGSICFFLGVALVFLKWPLLGMAIEAVGFVDLFGDFLPTVIAFCRRIPFLSTVLNLPGVAHVLDKIGSRSLPV